MIAEWLFLFFLIETQQFPPAWVKFRYSVSSLQLESAYSFKQKATASGCGGTCTYNTGYGGGGGRRIASSRLAWAI
jgi:uncharacterized membrane protein